MKNDFREVQDFFDIHVIFDAHVTAAALEFFGMENLQDTPTKHLFEGDIATASSEGKKKYLDNCMSAFAIEFAPRSLTL